MYVNVTVDAICTKFVTSAWLRYTRFELYTFRSNITVRYQNFGRCVTTSWALKRLVQNLREPQETAPSMFWFHDWSSVVKCKTVGSPLKSCKQHGRPWEIWIFIFRKCWDSWHLMWPFEISWWSLWRMEIICHANSDPINLEEKWTLLHVWNAYFLSQRRSGAVLMESRLEEGQSDKQSLYVERLCPVCAWIGSQSRVLRRVGT